MLCYHGRAVIKVVSRSLHPSSTLDTTKSASKAFDPLITLHSKWKLTLIDTLTGVAQWHATEAKHFSKIVMQLLTSNVFVGSATYGLHSQHFWLFYESDYLSYSQPFNSYDWCYVTAEGSHFALCLVYTIYTR